MKLSPYRAPLAALGVTILIASISLVPLAGQAPGSSQVAPKPMPQGAKPKQPTKAWTHPKTAWGDPDLQGIWSYATLTPLERPASQAEREKLTPEEIAALNSEHNDDGPLELGDGVDAYNKVWFDPAYTDGRTSLIVDPPNGRRPPLTPEGQKREAEKAAYRRAHRDDSWEDLGLAVRCIAYHGIPPMPSRYNNNYQIFQIPGYVVMYDEELTGARWIPLDKSPHISKSVGLWNGDSRGHWEGNTLVVETTNFSENAQYRIPSNPPTLRVIERFTRTAEDQIEDRFTIDDPATYTRPFTAVLPMSKIDGPIYEYACHEGNNSLPAILAGARAAEKAAAEGKATAPPPRR